MDTANKLPPPRPYSPEEGRAFVGYEEVGVCERGRMCIPKSMRGPREEFLYIMPGVLDLSAKIFIFRDIASFHNFCLHHGVDPQKITPLLHAVKMDTHGRIIIPNGMGIKKETKVSLRGRLGPNYSYLEVSQEMMDIDALLMRTRQQINENLARPVDDSFTPKQ